jgi:hypothetical protein
MRAARGVPFRPRFMRIEGELPVVGGFRDWAALAVHRLITRLASGLDIAGSRR